MAELIRKVGRRLAAMVVAGVVVVLLLALSGRPELEPPPAPDGEGAELQGGAYLEQEVNAVVTLVDIAPHTRLSAGMVALSKLPVSLRHSDAATGVQEVLDRQTTTALYEGEQILRSRMTDPREAIRLSYAIQPGCRAVSIPMNRERAVGGYVVPGTWVDVLGVFRAPEGSVVKPVVRCRKVLAVDGKAGVPRASPKPRFGVFESGPEDASFRAPEGFARVDDLRTVTLEVRSDEVTKLVLAAGMTDLHLTIVNPEEGADERVPLATEQQVRRRLRPALRSDPRGRH